MRRRGTSAQFPETDNWSRKAALALEKVPRLRMEIVKRRDDTKGLSSCRLGPPRWVVERPLSWFGENTR